MLEGGVSYNTFQSSWAKLCAQFREAIIEMKPRITISHPSDSALPEVINIDDDDDDEDICMLDGPASGRKRMSEETPSPSEKKPRYEQSAFMKTNRLSSPLTIPQHDGPAGTPKANGANGGLAHRLASPAVTRSPFARNLVEARRSNPFEEYLGAGKKFTDIEEIRLRINEHARAGVPDSVNDQVKNDMCRQSVTPWEGPLEKMVDKTLQMLRSGTEQILLSVLSKWQQTQLFKQSSEHMKAFFDEFENLYRPEATALYELETYKLFTVNTLAWEEYSQEEGAYLRQARKTARAKAYIKKELAMRRRPPYKDEAARLKAVAEVKDEQLGKDPFEKEMEVAAYVRGYYKTAALRFVDSVCLSINGKLFRSAKDNIFFYLEGQLGLNACDGEFSALASLRVMKLIKIRRRTKVQRAHGRGC
jgi:hypothetical protein